MMIKRKVDKFWFPWWPEKWLWGTIRIECTPAERGIWVDLLSLASKDDGYIRANEETPYPIKQLAGMLILSEKELDDAINKFLKLGKLIKTKTETLYVAKWEKYQFSDRHKRRVEGEMSEDLDIVSEKKDPIIDYSKLNYSTLDYKKEYELILNLLSKTKDYPFKEERDRKFIGNLIKEFSDLDALEEIKKKCAWWLSNPLLKKSNPHLQIRNWFINARKYLKEGDKDKKVGESSHTPSKKEDDYDKARAMKMKEIQAKYQLEIDKAMKAHASDWLDEIDNKIKEEIAEFSRNYKEGDK